jgi:hypothetical protein
MIGRLALFLIGTLAALLTTSSEGVRAQDLGELCSDGSNCESGICLQTSLGAICTRTCSNDCPIDYGCSLVPGPGGEPTALCVPFMDVYCLPCESSLDCLSIGSGDTCTALGGASYCTRDCSATQTCPAGFTCQELPGSLRQCIPTSRVCPGCIDRDGDGYGVGADCLGPDCNDSDAEETCAKTRAKGARQLARSLTAVRSMMSFGERDSLLRKGLKEFSKAGWGALAMLSPSLGTINTQKDSAQEGSAQERSALPFPDCMDYVWTRGEPRPPIDDVPSPFDTPPPGFGHGCEYGLTVTRGCRVDGPSSPIFKGRGTRSSEVCGQNFSPATHASTHRWDVDIAFQSDDVSFTFHTFTNPGPGEPATTEPPPPGQPGGVTVKPGQLLEISGLLFAFDLTAKDGTTYAAELRVCGCGPLTFSPACDRGRSPHTGTVLVQALTPGSLPGAAIIPGSCARGMVANCVWTIDNVCECPGGAKPSCP